MHINQKGEGKGGLITGLVVLALTIWVAWNLVPVMINVYSFEDKFREECKFPGRRSLEQLRSQLAVEGQNRELPVSEENIQITRIANTIKANCSYTVPIDFGFYVYEWNVSFDYEAPVFD